MNTIKSIYRVFTIGQSVANPASWKRGQITAAMLASLAGAAITLLKLAGVDLPLSDDDLLQLGGAVLTVYGVFGAGVTVASSDKIGLPPLAGDSLTKPGVIISSSAQIVSAIPAEPAPKVQRGSGIRNAADRI